MKFVLVLTLASIVVAGCGGGGGSSKSAAADFCSAATSKISSCSGSSAGMCEMTLETDCGKVIGLVSSSVVSGATACVKDATCSTNPFSCLGQAAKNATLTSAQKKLISDYCGNCSVLPESACEDAFVGSDGTVGALGYIVLPLGDTLAAGLDSDCTSSSFGKTTCQAEFTTCVQTSLVKQLAQTLSSDEATCFITALTSGGSSGGGGGGGNDDMGTMSSSDAGGGTGPTDGSSNVGGTCNALTNGAPLVTLQRTTGSVPSGIGGTIVDGTYYLTSFLAYDGAPAGSYTLRETRMFDSGSYEDVAQNNGSPDQSIGGTYSVFGNSFTDNLMCPYAASSQYTFDASPTSVTLYDGDNAISYTYSKQ